MYAPENVMPCFSVADFHLTQQGLHKASEFFAKKILETLKKGMIFKMNPCVQIGADDIFLSVGFSLLNVDGPASSQCMGGFHMASFICCHR